MNFRKVIQGLLIVWGGTMTILSIGLVLEVKNLRDVARGELDVMESRDEFYKRLFITQAMAIDSLRAEVQNQASQPGSHSPPPEPGSGMVGPKHSIHIGANPLFGVTPL